MNRQKLFLMVFLAVLLTGCMSPEAIATEIEKIEKAVVPFEDSAFIKVEFFDSPIFGMLRILSIPALIGLAWAVLKSKSTDPDFLGVVGVRFLILLLVGALSSAVIFIAFDSLGHVFWPDDLTFHFVRVSLGWTIPVIEKGSTLPDVFSWSLALTAVTMIPPLHQFVEIGLVIGTLITIGFAAFSGDLSGVWRMILAWMSWVVFPLMWVIVINGSRDALRSGVSPSSVAFGFWAVSWLIFAVLTIAPYFVTFPAPSVAPAPVAEKPPRANANSLAFLMALLGYNLSTGSRSTGGGGGRPGGDNGHGGNGAWPMGPQGSTGEHPPALLPRPRRSLPASTAGVGGGANGNGDHSQTASSTATYPSRGPRSDPADPLSPSSVTAGGASVSSRSGSLPQPRVVRESDKTLSGRQPFVPNGDRSLRGHHRSRSRGVIYRAKTDVYDANGHPILVRGQVVPAGEVKDGKLGYGGEWLDLSLLEAERGAS